jgi:hypothetical protein
MPNHVDLDKALEILTEISESEQPLEPSMRLVDLDIDSLDVLEWMFELGVEVDDLLEDGTLVESLPTMNLEELYHLIMADADGDGTTGP